MDAKRKTVYIAGVAVAIVLVGAATLRQPEAPVVPGAEAPKPALTVQIESPRLTSMPDEIGAHGSILPWQEASIGAEVDGLRLADVRVNVGDSVKRGDVLAVFSAETVAADLDRATAAVAEAEAAAAEAKANAERARSLQQTGALSEQQIQQFVTAEHTATARARANTAALELQRLRLKYTRVIAPDDGVISARNATVGAVVPSGQELFRLIRQGRLEWRAELTSDELARIRPGHAALISSPSGAAVKGTVRSIAPTVDVRTRLGLVYVDLDRAAELKAGAFARGRFALGDSQVLTIPQQAVVVRDGFSYVFRVGDDQRVEQVKVRTGRRNADRIELLGVSPDQPLVANGAGFLNDGDAVKVVASNDPRRTPAGAPFQPLHAGSSPVRL
jgi:RND family efflux transporter MFP subunit